MKECSDSKLRELQNLYEEDIQSLLELVYPNEPVKERNVRQASVIVRRWLCDNGLAQLSGLLGATATLPALADTKIFDYAANDPNIDYYLSAGVKFDGKPVMAFYHSRADHLPFWIDELRAVTFEEVRLGKVKSRSALYFEGQRFSLDEVLRFACNKLGGAHFEASRNARELNLERASRYLSFGPPEDTLPKERRGVIHLPLERRGAEVLSGTSLSVIVAATMLVNVRLNGVPLFELNGA